MKIIQGKASRAREARGESEDGWGGSLMLLIALNVAALVGAVWLVLSVPEALDRAADAHGWMAATTDDGAAIAERYQVNASNPSFASPRY